MRIHISTAPARPRPQVGDRKFIRGVEHVRVLETVKSGPHRGAYIRTNSGPCYEWIPLDAAPRYLRDMPGRLIGKRPEDASRD
ncbi:hypothetical protein [Bordetella phage vB_BbrM_PHB04]|uniref:Uncharacterized protein n=1 Tax=Bordetella phage vB_BbrM_PHB04 TaxID=2029657 RepID=A0A291LAP5_9CAUD|nr:hypothetical protein HOS14_gp069 [Bordetella phage vB_BbrM_PHB04]ATI15687.1 hypothetical protein [Bordetella phage vB_BbrM_PHB04]